MSGEWHVKRGRGGSKKERKQYRNTIRKNDKENEGGKRKRKEKRAKEKNGDARNEEIKTDGEKRQTQES
jgi:hypothetical protein